MTIGVTGWIRGAPLARTVARYDGAARSRSATNAANSGSAVAKGTKGIAILASCLDRRRPADDATPTRTRRGPDAAGITVVHVFDESGYQR
ncbi:MAG: hypothetical protein M3179_10515 [Actinomycetota bacterium]|nr:hypothetical protein [Actinomycetota bacterium]